MPVLLPPPAHVGRNRRSRGAAAVLLGLLALAPLARAQNPAAGAPPPAASPRGTLEAALWEAEQQAAARADALRTSYQAALTALRAKLRDAGNLDGVLAVDAETRRTQGAGWRSFPAESGPVAQLAELQGKCAKAVANLQAEESAARTKAYETCVQALDRQLRELVRADRLEDAKAVDAELKAVRAEQARTAGTPPGGEPAAPAATQPPAPGGFWAAPRALSLPPYACVHGQAQPGTAPFTVPFHEPFDALHTPGDPHHMSSPDAGVSFALQNSALVVEGYGVPRPAEQLYGPRLTAPVEHAGDFRLRASLRLANGSRACGRVVLFAVFADGQTAAINLFDERPDLAQLAWRFEIPPAAYSPRDMLPLEADGTPAPCELCLERRGDRVEGWVAGRMPQGRELRPGAGPLITIGLAIQRSARTGGEPLQVAVDLVEIVPLPLAGAEPGAPPPDPGVAGWTDRPPAPAPEPAPPAPALAAGERAIVRLDFNGGELPRYRREGTGALAERDGRLVVDSFGTNTRRTPFFGMRLVVPVMHAGDFRLVAPVNLESSGHGAGLIRLSALFSNRAEASCEISSARDSNYDGAAVFRFTGQADRNQPVAFSESPYYDDGFSPPGLSRIYLRPTQMLLTVTRTGTRIEAAIGSRVLGTAELTAASTTLTGFALDIQCARGQERSVAKMSVESVTLSAPGNVGR